MDKITDFLPAIAMITIATALGAGIVVLIIGIVKLLQFAF